MAGQSVPFKRAFKSCRCTYRQKLLSVHDSRLTLIKAGTNATFPRVCRTAASSAVSLATACLHRCRKSGSRNTRVRTAMLPPQVHRPQ